MSIPSGRYGQVLVYTNYTPDGVSHGSDPVLSYNSGTGEILAAPIPYIMVMFGGWSDSLTDPGSQLSDTWEFYDKVWTQKVYSTFPTARGGYSACFDGTRVVVFGGYNANTAVDSYETWGYVPGVSSAWTLLDSGAGTHPARNRFGALFNANGTIYYFGGWSGGVTYSNELWRWNVGSNTWTQITTTNTPGARGFMAIVYDSYNADVIMYGGYNGSVLDDTWTLNLSTFAWTQQTPAHTPGGRYSPAFSFTGKSLYAPASSVPGGPGLLLVGGTDGAIAYQESWVWSRDPLNGAPADWRKLQFAVPRARCYGGPFPMFRMGDGISGSPGSYIVQYHDYQYLFGGTKTPGVNVPGLDDFWAHGQVAFSPVPGIAVAPKFGDGPWTVAASCYLGTGGQPSLTPVARYDGMLAYWSGGGLVSTDPYLFAFGGFKTSGGAGDATDEAWVFTISSSGGWKRSAAATPSPRAEAGMRLDVASGKIILFGGYNGSGARLGDTWLYDPYYGWWIQVEVGASPSARSLQQNLEYDSNRSRLMFFGGWTGSSYLQDMYYFNYAGLTWSTIATASQPSGRWNFATAFDTTRNKYIVFGGYDGVTKLNDTWEWDSPAQTWANPTPVTSPPDGNRFRMDYVPSVGTIAFGGYTSTAESALSQETWKWNGTNWTDLSPSAFTPPARHSQMMLYSGSGSTLYMFAGASGPVTYSPTNDLLAYKAGAWVSGQANSNLFTSAAEAFRQTDFTSPGNNLISGTFTQGAGGLVQTLAIQQVNVSTNQIDLVFNIKVALIGAANSVEAWSISPVTGGAYPVKIKAVAVVLDGGLNTNTIRLTTEEDTDAATYNLNAPNQGVVSWATSLPWTGPFALSFTGIGTRPTVIMARSLDARLLEVIFSEAVVETEAMVAANYSVPGLTLTSVQKITDLVYRLTTSKQTVNGSYTVTVTGIHDISGNLIQ